MSSMCKCSSAPGAYVSPYSANSSTLACPRFMAARPFVTKVQVPLLVGAGTGNRENLDFLAMEALRFDPFSPAVDADPFPLYRRLRDEAPCFFSREADMWVLSRYADVFAALKDWKLYSSASGNMMT